MKKTVLDYIGKQFLFFDGGTGSVLQSEGLLPGTQPESWNIDHPDKIIALHEKYFLSGANIVKTNTFGANRLKFGDRTEEIVTKAVNLALKARDNCDNSQTRDRTEKNISTPRFVALDIGPSGKLLKPLGDLDFEEAISVFKESAIYGINAGADLVLIETMNDCYETKACVLGVKEAIESLEKTGKLDRKVPVFVTNVYDATGRLLTGSTVKEMTAILEGLGVDAIGMNCSLGPAQMESLVPLLVAETSLPVIVNPNAGLPKVVEGNTVYDVTAEQFAQIMERIALSGASILGGCCGTTPEFIQRVVEKVATIQVKPVEKKNFSVVTSGTVSVKIGQSSEYGKNHPVLIGERINPTGKKKLKEALREKNIQYILGEALTQEKNGAEILDINVGLPEIDETEMMLTVVKEVQSVTSLPLQIDTSNIESMEKALRIYNGKALINSLNGKESVMNQVFPLVKKYGGVVVALTLDEDGIPSDSAGRIKIAEKIYRTAESFGVSKKNILIDPLAMAVSSESNAPVAALETVRYVTEKLGGNTIMGVSNISFGLPKREIITSAFFAMAMENGLAAAIMNPSSVEMKKTWYSFCALRGFDKNCLSYIGFADSLTEVATLPTGATSLAGSSAPAGATSLASGNFTNESSLEYAVIKGLKEAAAERARELEKVTPLLEIIEKSLIPSLDFVGKAFEEKRLYLPQLLMSAEAASAAFDVIKESLKSSGTEQASRGKVILATVQGDIHDIGKNIVKVILENYGYTVIDLGKDVPPEKVVETCITQKIELVGLSALMTTTVPAMEKTITLLQEQCPWCKTCVGGAVLTQEYATKIGATYYSKDAMETVKCAREVFA